MAESSIERVAGDDVAAAVQRGIDSVKKSSQATAEEHRIFKEWFVGRDDIQWTELHVKPFELRISTELIHCTVRRIGPSQFLLDESGIARMRQEVESTK